MYDVIEIIDGDGDVVAEAENLLGAKLAVRTLLREGYDVLAIDAPDGTRLYTAWLDDDDRVHYRCVDTLKSRDLRAVGVA